MLADLLAVRRPSATAALQELMSEGLVRRDDGGLILEGEVMERLDEFLHARAS
jgi:Mn-dependent DtxR family transcriptional regulator